jgi:antitoxin VapB
MEDEFAERLGMGIIKLDEETFRLAERIASVSGDSVEAVVRSALEAKARATGLPQPDQPKLTPEEKIARIEAITARIAALPVYDHRTPDEILGYNERGVWD